MIWLLEVGLATVVLVLLWQPAITVAELKPQQNIIAVLVDDSRSMAIADHGATARSASRESRSRTARLAGLQKKFQTRLYRLDTRLTRIDGRPKNCKRRPRLRPRASATA